MSSQGRASIQFTLNGQRYELSRVGVESRLADVAPDAIRKHAVRVNDTWFPVIQAFEVATGIPRSEFISHTARRHLSALGYEISGTVEPRAVQPVRPHDAPVAASRRPTHHVGELQGSGEWQGTSRGVVGIEVRRGGVK